MKKADFRLAVKSLIKPDEPTKPIKTLTKTAVENAAKVFDIKEEEIKGTCRKQHFVKCRMFISFYLKDNGLTFHYIGNLINKDHSSIIHYLKTFNNEVKCNDAFKQDYEYFKSVNQ